MYICTMDNDVKPQDIPGVVALGEVSGVDLGGYGGVHMSKANRAACPDLAALANGVAANFNIVKASDEDAIAIFGWDDPDRAAKIWLDGGSDVAVITAGSKGTLVYTSKGKTIVPPLPIKAIDTTGGGDTFMVVPVLMPAPRSIEAPVGLGHGGLRHQRPAGSPPTVCRV